MKDMRVVIGFECIAGIIRMEVFFPNGGKAS